MVMDTSVYQYLGLHSTLGSGVVGNDFDGNELMRADVSGKFHSTSSNGWSGWSGQAVGDYLP